MVIEAPDSGNVLQHQLVPVKRMRIKYGVKYGIKHKVGLKNGIKAQGAGNN
jgi:hypothetical protein